MNLKKFSKQFAAGFDQLSFDEQLDVGLSFCKKLFFDYEVYIKNSNCSGDSDFVMDAIGAIKRYSTEEVTGGMVEDLFDTLKMHLQSLEDHILKHQLENDTKANCAYRAIEALIDTLFFLLIGEPKSIFNVASCLLTNAYSKVQENKALSKKEVDNHPAIQEARELLLSSVRQPA